VIEASRPWSLPWFGSLLLVLAVALGNVTAMRPGVFETIHRHLALDWHSLEHFELYRLVTSSLVQSSAGYTPGIFLLLLAVPLFETRAGTWAAIILFFVGDMLSTVLVLSVLHTAGQLGNAHAQRLATTPDSGSSSGAFACLAALLCLLPSRWAVLGWGGLVGYFLVRFGSWNEVSDYQHALAVLTGVCLVLGWGRLRQFIGRPWWWQTTPAEPA
jgi:hypothetical protein